MDNKYFLHQIKRTNGTIDKGIVVKDTFEAVQQSYHAYLVNGTWIKSVSQQEE